MNAAELFQQLNELDEHSRIEAKKGSAAGESILQTICAFANESDLGGGYILLGVAASDKTIFPTYEVVGVPSPDKVQSDLASQCASVDNRVLRPTIRAEILHGNNVLTVFIPEADPADKPIFIKREGLPRGAYRRIGSTDQRCSEADLRVLYRDDNSESYEGHVMADATDSDPDPQALQNYRDRRAQADPAAEELRWSNAELLRAVSATKDAEGVVKPTLAGLLLFGTTSTLRRLLPLVRIDYVRVPGLEWMSDPDRRFETIEIRAPLVSAIPRAYNAILDDLMKSFRLDTKGLARQDIPAIPERVIREALVNSVMHRSYRDHGPVLIIRYSNRLEIQNPGHSLIADDRLGQPGSQTRNPKVAAILHDLRFAENKGSGIRVMRELVKQNNLSPPTLRSDRVGNRFTVQLLFHHFLSQEDLHWLGNFREDNLSSDEIRALVFVRETGRIDNATFRDLSNGLDTLGASKRLRRLCERNLLVKMASGADTYYEGTERFRLSYAAKSEEFVGKSVELAAKSVELAAKSVELAAKSVELLNLAPELADAIRNLKGKASRHALRGVLLRLCELRPLTAAQLAKIINREEVPLRERHLGPMIASGELRYLYPDQPNHPSQAYRTTQGS